MRNPITARWIAVLGLVSLASLGFANDETRKSWQTSRIHGQPQPPDPYQIESAFPALSFTKPTSVTEIPGTGRLLITDQSGRLHSFPKDKRVKSTDLVGDLSQLSGNSVGALSVAFHPDFATNRMAFVCFTESGFVRVARFQLTQSSNPTIVAGSRTDLLQWPRAGHSGGCLRFAPDGYLYISTGDASGPNPPDSRDTGQDISDLAGSVLRVDVDNLQGNEGYSVPKDNPFVGVEGARTEIWSYGLRNPWKFGIDRLTGDIFVADNGWETWEMIHKLDRGSNCGWPIVEGRARLRSDVPRGPTPITPPIKDHPHTEANSVIGGPVYRGSALPELNGTFVYGDYITGTIWGITPATSGDGFTHQTLADTDLQIVDLTEGSSGEIYLLDYDTTGQLYQLTRSNAVDTSADFPRRLSETGLFTSTETLSPAEGVMPYSVVAGCWSDGADAQRWVAVPGTDAIALDPDDPSESVFPNGTVLAKQLTLPSVDAGTDVRVETQLLHYENGKWNPYSYLWDEEGKDASLVEPRGVNHTLRTANAPKLDRTWRVGSVNECRLCHNAASGVVLGFTSKQLANRDQLQRLAARGVIATDTAASGGALVDPHDAKQNLNARARSYLHANCGSCHNRKGPSTVSFFAHIDYPFADLKITKRPGIGTFDMESPQLVAPGAPYRSIILYRLSKLGRGRMPYVGTQLVDSDGVALIESWIRSLEDNVAERTATSKDPTSREAIDEMLSTTEGSLALASAMHRGEVSDIEYVQSQSVKLTAIRQGLFDHFVPESARRKTLGATPDLNVVLELQGDAGRGELIFSSDNARCRSCHDATDASKSTGPTLAEIRGKYNSRSELLKHIVNPSLKVDEKYTAWTVLTVNGRVLVGLIAEKNAQAMKLKLADESKVEIKDNQVEAIKKSKRSLMPDGTLGDLTPQEAADLLEYLITLPVSSS